MIFAVLTRKTLVLVLLLAALAACGGASLTPTLTATQNLEARAVAASSSASDGTWLEQFQYTSPRSREVCDSSGYAARVANFASLIIGMEGVSDDPTIEFLVKDVIIEGAEGTVSIGYLLDGKRAVVYDEGKRRWVLLDGQWWEEHGSWLDAWGGNCLSRGNSYTRLDLSAASLANYSVNRFRTARSLKKAICAELDRRGGKGPRTVTHS